MLTATEFEITLGREAPPFVLLHCSWGGLAFWSVDRTAADFRRCESALRELHANGLTDLSVPSVGADDENGLTAASLQPFVARAAEICSSALPSGSPACEPVLALVGAARALYQQLVAQNAQLVLQAAQLEGLRARLASAEAAQRLAICAPSDGERGVLAPLPAGARLSSGTPSTTRRGGRAHEPKPRAASARSTGSSALSLSELEVGEDGARVGPAVLRAGWLKKRSFFLGQWRLRWVELAAGHLVTRATCEPGAPSTLSLNLGSMAQSKAVSVEPRSLCSFDVRANGTLYAFEAESAGMRDEWVRTLRAELARPTQRAEG